MTDWSSACFATVTTIGRLTASIRRIIEIMKQDDLLAEDIKAEYRRLIREKEALQALADRLELDVERRRKRVLDVDLIRRSLQDFARLVGLLPLEDQKELFQLLLREVEVQPFDPESAWRRASRATATAAARWRGGRRAGLHGEAPHPAVPGADRALPAAGPRGRPGVNHAGAEFG